MCSWETPSPSRDACDNPRTCRLPPRGTGVSLGRGGSGAAALGHSGVFLVGDVPLLPCSIAAEQGNVAVQSTARSSQRETQFFACFAIQQKV